MKKNWQCTFFNGLLCGPVLLWENFFYFHHVINNIRICSFLSEITSNFFGVLKVGMRYFESWRVYFERWKVVFGKLEGGIWKVEGGLGNWRVFLYFKPEHKLWGFKFGRTIELWQNLNLFMRLYSQSQTVVPISLITAMEQSTLVQGAADVVEHLPHYIQDLKAKVIDNRQPAHKMPPANVVKSLAKQT